MLLSRKDPNANNGSKSFVESHGDGEQGLPGSSVPLLFWDISSIPTNAIVQSVQLTLDLYNRSPAPYRVHQILAPWDELTVTWNNFDINTNLSSTILATIPPEKFNLNHIDLNASGLAMVQGWITQDCPQGSPSPLGRMCLGP